MKMEIKVIPQAKRNQLKKDKERTKVYLTAPAVDGKANKALVVFLADYFKVKKSQISILKGTQSRIKLIEITDQI